MAAIGTPVATKWEYSNGAFETDTETFANGHQIQYSRSVWGPIPHTEPLIRGIVAQVDPNNQNWEATLRALLAANRFFTNQVAASKGRNVGYRLSSYLSSSTFAINLCKAAAAGTLALGAAFGPSIAKKVAPESMQILGLDDGDNEEKKEEGITGFFKKHIVYSGKIWWKVLRGETFNGGIRGATVAIATGATILAISKPLFDELSKAVGSKEFNEWRRQKLTILQANKTIPEAFEQDPILQENTCPITSSPIRVPVSPGCHRTHIFEEAALQGWIVNQIDQGAAQASCPLDRLPIEQVALDQNLSDRIELRLFLLMARRANGL